MAVEGAERAPITVNIILSGSDNEDLHAFYQEARDRYLTETTALVDALKEYGTLKSEIDESETVIKRIETRWKDEQGFKDCKNDAAREVFIEQMRGRTATSGQYQTAALLVHANRRKLLTITEPEIERSKYLRRLAEKDCEWGIAALQAISGIVEAGRHEQR